MTIWTTNDALIAVIGSLGIIATGVVLLYSFRRNKTGDGKYQ